MEYLSYAPFLLFAVVDHSAIGDDKGRHSVEGRNIFIPSSEKAGMLSFMIWISIIAISAIKSIEM